MSDKPQFSSKAPIASAPVSFYEVKPEVVWELAKRIEGVPFGEMSRADRELLSESAACRFSCEYYLTCVAQLRGKKLVFVSNNIPLDEVPEE